MKKAFTLIELLVVVLIIGILSAVALPQYEKAVEKARAAEAVVNLRSLEKAIDIWILENGYPEHHGPTFLYWDGEPGDTPLVLDFNGKTKYFTYGAACEDGSCDALVRRHFDDFGEVEVNANKSPSTNIWEETSCRYSNRSEANKAKAFCSAFGLEAEYEK